MVQKAALTIEERINRALEGRKQSWVVMQMVNKKIEMTDVTFSRKKKGYSNFKFTDNELHTLSDILGVDLIS
jgi:hypothetical protein